MHRSMGLMINEVERSFVLFRKKDEDDDDEDDHDDDEDDDDDDKKDDTDESDQDAAYDDDDDDDEDDEQALEISNPKTTLRFSTFRPYPIACLPYARLR